MLGFAVVISVSFSLGKRAAPHIDPAALTAARFALAVLLSVAVAAPLLRRAHLAAGWRHLLLGGLFAGYFILMFEALRLTDAVSTAAIFTLIPAMSAVFARVLLGQRTGVRTALALGLGGAGALWVTFRGDLAALLGLALGPGERLFLLGCALHALYTPLVRRFDRGEPAAVFGLGTLLGGLLVTLLWAGPTVAATDWAGLPPVVWAAILYLGAAATAGSFHLMRYAALRLPAAKVLAYGYLVPSLVILWEGIATGVWVAGPVLAGVAATIGALLLLLRADPGG